MSDIFHDTIPCEDCAEQRQYLSMKFEVLDCEPDASQPGACVIRYRRKDAAAAGPLAGLQPQLKAKRDGSQVATAGHRRNQPGLRLRCRDDTARQALGASRSDKADRQPDKGGQAAKRCGKRKKFTICQ